MKFYDEIYVKEIPHSCIECGRYRETFGDKNGYRCKFKQVLKGGTSARFNSLEKLYKKCPLKVIPSLKECASNEE